MTEGTPEEPKEIETNLRENLSLTMEEKITECRRVLQEDLINKQAFELRYRPDLERMQSSCLVWRDEMCALRRFQVAEKVYELVEFLIRGQTDCVLFIDFQTKRILEYSRYLDAEVTLVDQIQDTLIKLGEK